MSNNILFFSFSLLLFITTTKAFNITSILNQYSDFSSFNSYLTQTGVANLINGRQTLTVLAISNDGISSISSQSTDVMKNILSLHTILDYYDEPKLKSLGTKPVIVTTLFQTTGLARGQQGFLNITTSSGGQVTISSAAPGSSGAANVVNSVYTQPYNISVLQVSGAVIPSGAGSNTNSTNSPSPPGSNSPNAAPSPSNKAPSPSGNANAPSSGGASGTTTPTPTGSATPPTSSSSAPSPSTGSAATNGTSPPPADNADSPAASPSSGDAADSPTVASPPAMTPTGAASGPVADGPAGADAPDADASGKKSGAIALTSSTKFGILFVITSVWIMFA